jgi:hypothetical protein
MGSVHVRQPEPLSDLSSTLSTFVCREELQSPLGEIDPSLLDDDELLSDGDPTICPNATSVDRPSTAAPTIAISAGINGKTSVIGGRIPIFLAAR